MTTQVAEWFEDVREPDELGLDRLPGMPMLGFFTGTVLSLALWGAVALVVWSLAA